MKNIQVIMDYVESIVKKLPIIHDNDVERMRDMVAYLNSYGCTESEILEFCKLCPVCGCTLSRYHATIQIMKLRRCINDRLNIKTLSISVDS